MTKYFYRLNSKRLKNKELHHFEVSEIDYSRVKPKIELLKRLSEVEHFIYAIYDMHKCNYLMQSEEQKKLFGYDKQYGINSEDHYKIYIQMIWNLFLKQIIWLISFYPKYLYRKRNLLN